MDSANAIFGMPHPVSALQPFSFGTVIGNAHVLDIDFASTRSEELRNVLGGVVSCAGIRICLTAEMLFRRRPHSRGRLCYTTSTSALVLTFIVKVPIAEVMFVAGDKIVTTISQRRRLPRLGRSR